MAIRQLGEYMGLKYPDLVSKKTAEVGVKVDASAMIKPCIPRVLNRFPDENRQVIQVRASKIPPDGIA